jgi:cytochrome oxidase Cu insertion factor (SCO1/SenC/PrrC family)
LRLVTFTVDPSRDRPQELKDYADKFRANADRWLFLTGDENTIHKLLRERFKQGVSRKTGDVKPGDEYDHSTRLAVVDRNGVIRAVFDGIRNENFPDADPRFEANLTALKERVKGLLAE